MSQIVTHSRYDRIVQYYNMIKQLGVLNKNIVHLFDKVSFKNWISTTG